jgi:hypothetical protein
MLFDRVGRKVCVHLLRKAGLSDIAQHHRHRATIDQEAGAGDVGADRGLDQLPSGACLPMEHTKCRGYPNMRRSTKSPMSDTEVEQALLVFLP